MRIPSTKVTYICLYFHSTPYFIPFVYIHSFCDLTHFQMDFLKPHLNHKEYIFTLAKIQSLCHIKHTFQLFQMSKLNQTAIILLRVLCLVQIALSLSLRWNEFILYAHQTKNGSRTVKIFEHL